QIGRLNLLDTFARHTLQKISALNLTCMLSLVSWKNISTPLSQTFDSDN
ncbi:unnamed protein product, partial [Allacma fusca]